MGLPWDQPVPEKDWIRVAEYCDNDVISLEAVFNDRKADFTARQILAELSGLTVNDTDAMHVAKILFGDEPHPQEKFVYTQLATLFPGYTYRESETPEIGADGIALPSVRGKSNYRGEDPGEGGYVYAEPGMYENVALLDVASMHPTSIVLLNLFGPYTGKYAQLKAMRIAIKEKKYDEAKKMLGGTLAKYFGSPEESQELAYALKIALNKVYGMTSATFPNKFRDPRNVDNIVAKRGALFMIDLKHAVQEQGFTVCHIKTDSIKIPNATPEIISFVQDFGRKYGYDFTYEDFYSKFCLLNDAVYIAKYKTGKKAGKWTATGAQFAQPYVFKHLFSHEQIVFDDLCETRAVSSALYLDKNEELGEGHNYCFIGKVGLFCPIKKGAGGGLLLRQSGDKYSSVAGCKGYRWLEAEMVRELHRETDIDESYFIKLVDDALNDISKFGDAEAFVS